LISSMRKVEGWLRPRMHALQNTDKTSREKATHAWVPIRYPEMTECLLKSIWIRHWGNGLNTFCQEWKTPT
jgi:hypothetical protein